MTDSVHDVAERDTAPRPQRRTIILTVAVLAILLGALFLWRTDRKSVV